MQPVLVRPHEFEIRLAFWEQTYLAPFAVLPTKTSIADAHSSFFILLFLN